MHAGAVKSNDLSTRGLSEAKILLVGAGGLGCELLKILVLSGIIHITVVDLDTVDVTNLNRQFLFRRQHVGLSKAKVACGTMKRYRPQCQLVPHQANIKGFSVAFFEGFDYVIGALDNLEARRYINKICIALNKPLFESGTGGMFGQATAILRRISECYDCQKKEEPKTYPICTIRTTPSKPVHCIVWAKDYLFAKLFGGGLEEMQSGTIAEAGANQEELKRIQKDEEETQRLIGMMGKPEFSERIFRKLFDTDIRSLAEIDQVWTGREAPVPLDWEELSNSSSSVVSDKVELDHRVWTIQETFQIFKSTLGTLCKRKMISGKPLTFTKDDSTSVDFVTASTNLRAHAFHIKELTRFEIKEISGRITPIVATTNTITSALTILNLIKFNRASAGAVDIGTVHCIQRRYQLIQKEATQTPNPSCSVCSRIQFHISVKDFESTLGDLIQNVIHQMLKVDGEEEISITEAERILFDPDFDDNTTKTLCELGISDGCYLVVRFEDDESRRFLSILLADGRDGQSEPFVMHGNSGIHELQADTGGRGLDGKRTSARLYSPVSSGVRKKLAMAASPGKDLPAVENASADVIDLDEDMIVLD